MSFTQLILASASPRRVDLLKQVGVPFVVYPALIQEWEDANADPEQLVLHNAQLKAQWVSERHPKQLVLGADTTVALGQTVLNKPTTPAHAVEMLLQLSGQKHVVYTAFCLKADEPSVNLSVVEASYVYMKPFSESVAWEYVNRVHTLDKAGGYSILEHPDLIIDSFSGELSTIVGLPLSALKRALTTVW